MEGDIGFRGADGFPGLEGLPGLPGDRGMPGMPGKKQSTIRFCFKFLNAWKIINCRRINTVLANYNIIIHFIEGIYIIKTLLTKNIIYTYFHGHYNPDKKHHLSITSL